ncbi:MAG: efflux RND transporter periplasmic adaptor subunit [Desulfurivibrionaceae bacterium]
MRPPVTPLLVISLLTTLLFPISSRASSEESRYFKAEPAADRVILTGFTRARATMKLTSLLTERIIEVKGDTGDRIGKDGVFARLDPSFAELDLQGVKIEQEKVTSRIDYLENELRRYRTLFEKQSVSEAKLDSLTHELDQARLTLRELQTEEQRLREHLKRHLITGPAGWLVIARHAEPGEWVTMGTPLAEIGDFRTLLVPFAVSHAEYLRIKQTAKALSLHLPEEGLTVPAELHTISPDFDPQTRKFNLELIIGTPLPEQRGGIRTELAIEMPEPGGALLVPASAVDKRYDTHWLTAADGEKVAVIVLGPGPEPLTLRVSGEGIKAGDKFLRAPADDRPADRE